MKIENIIFWFSVYIPEYTGIQFQLRQNSNHKKKLTWEFSKVGNGKIECKSKLFKHNDF